MLLQVQETQCQVAILNKQVLLVNTCHSWNVSLDLVLLKFRTWLVTLELSLLACHFLLLSLLSCYTKCVPFDSLHVITCHSWHVDVGIHSYHEHTGLLITEEDCTNEHKEWGLTILTDKRTNQHKEWGRTILTDERTNEHKEWGRTVWTDKRTNKHTFW